MNPTEYFKAMIVELMDQINNLKSSPTQKLKKNPPDPTTMVPANRRDPPLDIGKSTKIGGM